MLILEAATPGAFRFSVRSQRCCSSFGVDPDNYKQGLDGAVSREEFARSFNNINEALQGRGIWYRIFQIVSTCIVIAGFATFAAGIAATAKSASSNSSCNSYASCQANQNDNSITPSPILFVGLALFVGGGVLAGISSWAYISGMNAAMHDAVRRENAFYNAATRPNKSTWTYHARSWQDARYVYSIAYLEIDTGMRPSSVMTLPNVIVSMPYVPPVPQYVQHAPYPQNAPPAYFQQPQQQQHSQFFGVADNSVKAQPDAAMQLCPRCQAKVQAGNAFCGSCGTSVVA